MLASLALLFLCGLLLGGIFNRLKLPGLIGMLLTGMILGPYALNLLDSKLLSISYELRQIALIIILMRAGLNLNLDDLKKVGRPAILLCFVPACFEIVGMVILGPILLNISILDALILGSVIAAVSPAVVVPRMLRCMEQGYGTKQSIPQMILAGASVDDVFVIVLFSALTSLAQSGSINALSLLAIPSSILLGILTGLIVGLLLHFLYTKISMSGSVKVLILLSVSFLMVTLEKGLSGIVGFSGLLAVMMSGITLQKRMPIEALCLSSQFSKLWMGAEILLFVLVGATVDISYALRFGVVAILLLLAVLLFRVLGVVFCLIKTPLNFKERLFCCMAYLPKATVQAAIGSIPLTMGLPCGEVVLTVAVLSILITAPLGALLVDNTYTKLLSKENVKS